MLMKTDMLNDLKWVVSAQVLDNYNLKLFFNDGICRLFNCQPLIENNNFFSPLRNRSVFENISLDGWTVAWADGAIDIAPEYLYDQSTEAQQCLGNSKHFN